MRSVQLNIFLILSLLILAFVNVGFSQDDVQEQLAAQYLQSEEYEKAIVIYEELFNKKSKSYYYKPYMSCLISLEEFDKAEKVLKKLIKKDKSIYLYTIDLGYVYKLSGKIDKSKDVYENIIEEIIPEEENIHNLANSFLARNELDYAIKTFIKGQKSSRKNHLFNYELAEIYNKQNKLDKVLEHYFKALDTDHRDLQKVKDLIQDNIFSNDASGKKEEYLRTFLIKKVQKSPDNKYYYDLLIWYFVQARDFESAMLHVKAMDKRFKEGGRRAVDLAKICDTEGYYDIAISLYDYVIKLDEFGDYYVDSRIGIINSRRNLVTSGNYTNDDLLKLKADYDATLKEFGLNELTAEMVTKYAKLLAFYMNELEEGINLLDNLINMLKINPKIRAEAKLTLGDILLFNGEVWDAKLYYGQVEKEYKYDVLGQDAKYRNAKLSYYIGEFDWAKAQLDVLKAATSKLIANDALQLSLLISDNSTLDTVAGLLMFAKADMLLYQSKVDSSLLVLDSLLSKYPFHSLTDEVLLKKAEIYLKQYNYDSSLVCLNTIIDDYIFDILADDAFFMLGDIYENHYKDLEKASNYYLDLMTKFPGSLYTVESRKRYRKLRGENIDSN